jgi:hypothetical protein
MVKYFREYLFSISQLPVNEQKEKLETEFLRWKGSESQTDDVLIVGIKPMALYK